MVAITPAPVASAPTVAPAKSRTAQQAQIQHRVAAAQRDDDEHRRRDDPPAEQAERRAQPAARLCTRPASTPANARPSSSMPQPSTGRGRSAVDSLSPARAQTASSSATTARTAYGIRQPDVACAARPAATSGPIAMPAPTPAPHTPVARTRAGPAGTTCPINPRPHASTAAPPRPWPTLASTSVSVSGANVATSDATASTNAPATNMRRLPWSSPTAPAGSSATASPQLIELRIHACPLGPAPSAVAVAASVPIGVV